MLCACAMVHCMSHVFVLADLNCCLVIVQSLQTMSVHQSMSDAHAAAAAGRHGAAMTPHQALVVYQIRECLNSYRLQLCTLVSESGSLQAMTVHCT